MHKTISDILAIIVILTDNMTLKEKKELYKKLREKLS